MNLEIPLNGREVFTDVLSEEKQYRFTFSGVFQYARVRGLFSRIVEKRVADAFYQADPWGNFTEGHRGIHFNGSELASYGIHEDRHLHVYAITRDGDYGDKRVGVKLIGFYGDPEVPRSGMLNLAVEDTGLPSSLVLSRMPQDAEVPTAVEEEDDVAAQILAAAFEAHKSLSMFNDADILDILKREGEDAIKQRFADEVDRLAGRHNKFNLRKGGKSGTKKIIITP